MQRRGFNKWFYEKLRIHLGTLRYEKSEVENIVFSFSAKTKERIAFDSNSKLVIIRSFIQIIPLDSTEKQNEIPLKVIYIALNLLKAIRHYGF